MTQEKPLVSIIVRTKDRPRMLQTALRSIAAQSHRPLEVVLVNDGGCDLDIDEIARILEDVQLTYIRLEKNMGRAHAGNAGIGKARGKYIGFLDDDDEIYPEHIATLAAFLEQNDYNVAYTGTEMVFREAPAEDGTIKDTGKSFFSRDFSYSDLLTGNYIPFNSILFRKAVLTSTGGLDENFELYEDWDLLIRIGENNPFHHIDKITAKYIQWSADQQINRADTRDTNDAYVRIISKHRSKIGPHIIVDLVFRKAQLESEMNSDRTRTVQMVGERDREIQRLGQAFAELEQKAKELERKTGELEQKAKGLERKAGELESLSREKDIRISGMESVISEAGENIERLENTVREQNLLISQSENTIAVMRNTLGWRALERFRGLREKLLPPGKTRRKAYDLSLKSIRVLRNEGPDVFIRKAGKKIRERGYGAETLAEIVAPAAGKKDILFVSGCPGDAFRYRCLHQLEEAVKQGLTGATAFHGQIDLLASLPEYHFFVLHRVPIDSHVSAFIEAADAQNKIVIFDTDDLVFDEAFAVFVHALKTMSETEKELYHDGLKRYRATLLLCKHATTTTEYLAEEIRKLGLSVFINRNAVSDEMAALAEEALIHAEARGNGRVVIGYLSGTPTHDADFACASGALLRMLDKFDFVDLLVVGHLTLPETFDKYGERVIRKPLMPWRDLPKLTTSIDINIAPLEKNPFCESKSELKFLEAALVRVPTVASNIGGFRTAIKNGTNGFLAEDEEGWVKALSLLIEDPGLRQEIGEKANKDVMESYTTSAIGKNLTLILNSVNRSRIKKDCLNIGWVLQAPFKGSGGYTTIFRTISFLQQFGHNLTVYIDPIAHLAGKTAEEIKQYTNEHFPPASKIVVGHDRIAAHDILVATAWPTAYTVMHAKWSFRKIYFVQDHEPDFYSQREAEYARSEKTYRLGLPCLTIGPYLSKMLKAKYGAATGFFDFSIDPHIYFAPSEDADKNGSPRRIIFYARPETKRRGFDMGISALKKVYKKYPDTEILLFGSENLSAHKIPFPYTNLGIMKAEELGRKYRESGIGLSISMTNLSLVPLEMMACGCVVVEIDSPRCEGTLRHRENSMLAEPDEESIAAAICELISNRALYEKLQTNGISFAAGRTHESAARQFEKLLLKEIDEQAG